MAYTHESRLPGWLAGSVAAAVGRAERDDAVLERTGGPAGNARLTAWTGILLLVLFAAEGLTLLDVHGLISWHVALGALVIPPVLLKIGSTTWRMIGYYRGALPYRAAGPPPVLLRVVGPVVVLSTVALLATGVVLILLGQDAGHASFGRFLFFRVDWIWLHQVSFVIWVAAMTIHVLGRTIPGARIAARSLSEPRAVPGIAARAVALVLVAALGAGCAVVLVSMDHSWTLRRDFHHFGQRS